MRVFTIITRKDPAALKAFVQSCIGCRASGVSIFTRPEFVQPVNAPGTASEADLQAEADALAARKDYAGAARIQEQIKALTADRVAIARTGVQWIADEIQPIKDITQLVVIVNPHWPTDIAFTVANFFSRMEGLSAALLSTGIAGIVQQTPLAQRSFIPLVGAGGGSGTQGDPAAAVPLLPAHASSGPAPTSPRHPSLPANLTDKEAKYAGFRLGLDRHGARRSRNEAGNMVGYSPAVAQKMENAVAAKWTTFIATVNDNTAPV